MDDQDAISINAYRQKEYPTLPYDGWIKVCSNKSCRTITSNFIYSNYKNHKFKLYFCPHCTKRLDLVSYIQENYREKMKFIIRNKLYY